MQQRMTKPLFAFLLLLPLIALGEDEEPCIACYCDVVYYCETTKLIDVKPDGEIVNYKNEPFRFALKGGELVVPKGGSLLGDGTANWDLLGTGCFQNSPGKPFGNKFSARLFGGAKYLEFRDGSVQASDLSLESRSRIWFAECDTFE